MKVFMFVIALLFAVNSGPAHPGSQVASYRELISPDDGGKPSVNRLSDYVFAIDAEKVSCGTIALPDHGMVAWAMSESGDGGSACLTTTGIFFFVKGTVFLCAIFI